MKLYPKTEKSPVNFLELLQDATEYMFVDSNESS